LEPKNKKKREGAEELYEEILGWKKTQDDYADTFVCVLARCCVDSKEYCSSCKSYIASTFLPAGPNPTSLPANCTCLQKVPRKDKNQWVSRNWGGSGGDDPQGMPPLGKRK
jgi:hypothetical protein